MKAKILIPLVVFLLLFKTTEFKAQCNLICNGSFETTPLVPPNPVSSSIVNSSLVPCWSSTNNVIEVWEATFANFISVIPFAGTQFIELNDISADRVYQNFTATPGLPMTINFAHRGRQGVDVMGVEIGPVGGPFTNLGNFTDGTGAWGAYAAAYVPPPATGNLYQLRFYSVSWSSSSGPPDPAIGNFLDAVSVTQNSVSCSFIVTPQITQSSCTSTNNAVTLLPSNGALTYNYQWSSGAGNTPNATNLPPGVYHVTVTATCGCATIPVVTHFTINPVPPVPVISVTAVPLSRCVGFPVTLTASGANSYVWQPGNLSGNSVMVNPSVGTTYTVYGTNSAGCTGSTTVYVPAPLPNPIITVSSAPSIFCVGSTLTLTASGASTYIWYPGGTTGNTLVNPTPGTLYTIVGTSAAGCITTFYYTAPYPLPNPVINVSSSPATRCMGTPASLSASGGVSYVWQPGNWSGNPYSVNPSVATTYTVVGTGANGCTATAVHTVPAPIPNPVVNINASSNLICAGTPNTLTASGAHTYVWFPGGSVNPLIVNPTSTTVYYVFGTNTVTGCQGFNTITLTPAPTISLGTSNATLCTNSATSISIGVINYIAAPISYVWQPGNLPGQNVIVSPLVSTQYTVYATSPVACPSSITLSVTVIDNCCSQPTAGLTPLATSLSGIVGPGSYFASSNVVLSGNTSLSSAEFLFMPGTKLIVPPGVTLELDEAHLFACGIKMWEGIDVQDGGRVITSNRKLTSLIEDAQVGILLDNISMTNSSPNPPIEIDNVVFNKNFIGIKISNSDPNLNTLALGIKESVFTSRQLQFGTFPSALIWPSASNITGNLRAASSPTTGLITPYDLQNYAPTTIKISCRSIPTHASQTGHIGIDIENVGNMAGSLPGAGVDIGVTYGGGVNDFNLFDGLGAGIYVEDASLSTVNNVFQNMTQFSALNGTFGGWGIRHITNSLMNSGLFLTPASQLSDYGNRFWDNYFGVYGTNTYMTDMQYGIFRSNHLVSPSFGPGAVGITIYTNRFDNCNINFNEFNNIAYNVWFGTNNGAYDIGGLNNGTYAGNLNINQNFIGPEVNSTNMVPPGTMYSNFGITLWGSNGANWNIQGNCKVLSNKLDRLFRGIRSEFMDSYPIEIGGNHIRLVDDNMLFPMNDQYGIYASNSLDNLHINLNDITGDGPVGNSWNQRMRLVLSENNQSISNTVSPKITCNITTDAYIGFEFDGPQPNTEWTGNDMNQRMHMGLSLINNGQIGTQGSLVQACNDRWNDNGNPSPFNWVGFGNWQTHVDASSSAFPGSFLWCNPFPNTLPVTNGGANPFNTLAPFQSIDQSKKGSFPDCFYQTTYPTLPSQRPASPTGLNEAGNSDNVWVAYVYPNPSQGVITVRSNNDGEILDVKITDLNGKVVFAKQLKSEKESSIDLKDLSPSVYFIEVKNEVNDVTRQKLILTE